PAQIQATRFETEVFVPPLPGQEVRKAHGAQRNQALFYDGMTRKLACGLSRDDEPAWLNLDFLDGTRGAHVNISGISGVATKTTYALFLLYGLFHGRALASSHSAHSIIFNVKGEDLLWLDRPNIRLGPEHPEALAQYEALGLPVQPFDSVGLWAPTKPGAVP